MASPSTSRIKVTPTTTVLFTKDLLDTIQDPTENDTTRPDFTREIEQLVQQFARTFNAALEAARKGYEAASDGLTWAQYVTSPGADKSKSEEYMKGMETTSKATAERSQKVLETFQEVKQGVAEMIVQNRPQGTREAKRPVSVTNLKVFDEFDELMDRYIYWWTEMSVDEGTQKDRIAAQRKHQTNIGMAIVTKKWRVLMEGYSSYTQNGSIEQHTIQDDYPESFDIQKEILPTIDAIHSFQDHLSDPSKPSSAYTGIQSESSPHTRSSQFLRYLLSIDSDSKKTKQTNDLAKMSGPSNDITSVVATSSSLPALRKSSALLRLRRSTQNIAWPTQHQQQPRLGENSKPPDSNTMATNNPQYSISNTFAPNTTRSVTLPYPDIYAHPAAIAYVAAHPHRTIRTFGPYIVLQTLGKGESSIVKLGLQIRWGEEVAVKLIRRPNVALSLSQIEREIESMRSLKHPNIVSLYDVIETDKYIGIILEYASGGELFDYILTHRYLRESIARRLFAQLISGVWYLHQKKIVHRDLTLHNLLLDQHRNLVIIDFSFANRFEHRTDDLMQTSCGTPFYAAPELVMGDGLYVGSAVDIWSCGVILYAMLTGYLPFDDDPSNPDGDNIQLLYRYIVGTPLSFPDYVVTLARDLVSTMLVTDPTKRTTLEGVMHHKWLKDYWENDSPANDAAPRAFGKSVDDLEHEDMERRQARNKKRLRSNRGGGEGKGDPATTTTYTAPGGSSEGQSRNSHVPNKTPQSHSPAHQEHHQRLKSNQPAAMDHKTSVEASMLAFDQPQMFAPPAIEPEAKSQNPQNQYSGVLAELLHDWTQKNQSDAQTSGANFPDDSSSIITKYSVAPSSVVTEYDIYYTRWALNSEDSLCG